MKTKITLAILFSFLTTTVNCNHYHEAILNNNINKLYAITKQKVNGINQKAKYGNTPLHLAVELNVKLNNETIIQFLIDNWADRFLINDNGQTPLHIAAKACPLSVMKIIILSWPSYFGNDARYNKLVIYLNTKDFNGNTFLHLICQRTDIPHDFIQKLIEEFGANKSIQNKFGQKPQDIAKNTFDQMAIKSQSILVSSPKVKNIYKIIEHLLSN